MKIAFWSNVAGKGYTTANAVAISIMEGLMNTRVLLFENHTGFGGIADALIYPENDNMVREKNSDYNNLGLSMLIKKARAGLFDENGVNNNIINFIDGNLSYLPTRPDMSREVLEFELNIVIKDLIEYLEGVTDNIVIDTSNNYFMTTRTIVDLADIVVVNLCQNRNILDDIFINHPDITRKAFFVIGNYEPYSRMDISAICRRYGIKKSNIGVIPYNYRYRESLINGSCVDFIKKNVNCKRRDENYYFIKELKETVKKLNDVIGGSCNANGEIYGTNVEGTGDYNRYSFG